VLAWGALSAVGVSALVTANRLAYDLLRGAGAGYLLYLGVLGLLARGHRNQPPDPAGRPSREPGTAPRQVRRAAVRPMVIGVVNGVANPKLAVFFVAVLPQFLAPGTPVLPAALGMAGLATEAR
jgi:threonine/homoserine/homoserine lactone efflux protein